MKTPEELLKRWMGCVNGGDIDSLVALYREDAVLIPTFSNRILKGHDALRGYFERLSGREDLSIALHEKTLVLQSLGGSVQTLSGIYNWRFAVDGEILNFEARFSYLLDLSSESPIVHHHSSQIPRTL